LLNLISIPKPGNKFEFISKIQSNDDKNMGELK